MDRLLALLEAFQRAYAQRDVESVDAFLEACFVRAEPIFYGTSPAEQCIGKARIRRMLIYDWTVWGALKLDMDSLIAHDYGSFSDFVVTGYMDWTIPEDELLSRAMMDVKDMVLRGGPARTLLEQMNAISAKMLMEAQRGERHLLPVRLSGMAMEEEGELKFSSLHMSHPTQNYPDCRLEW